jgi:large subunit ribosomal protein L29
MKAAELRQLSPGELEEKLDEAKEEYFNLRFQRASGQLQDFNQLRLIRRRIARIYTVMRELELEADWEAEGDE